MDVNAGKAVFKDFMISMARIGLGLCFSRDIKSNNIIEVVNHSHKSIIRLPPCANSPSPKMNVEKNIIQSLIGENILFHYSKLNMKGPKVGSIVEWHQDFSYYPHTNTDLLTALIFFDNATQENGCLQVIPGSHKNGLLSHDIDGFFRGKISDVNKDDV